MKVMGVDCSTQKMSWVIVDENGKIDDYGEIFFIGSNFIKRYQDIRTKVMAELDTFKDVDYIAFEKAIMARNQDVALKLAGSFAVALSCLAEVDAQAVEVAPTTWQTAIGNPVIKAEGKKQLLAMHTELKTKSKQQAFIRNYRKQKTIDYVENRTGIKMPNDDLGDAAGIALFMLDKIDYINSSEKLAI